jgi:hypothetical protein
MKFLPPTKRNVKDARMFTAKIRELNARLLAPVARHTGDFLRRNRNALSEMPRDPSEESDFERKKSAFAGSLLVRDLLQMIAEAEKKVLPKYSRATEPIVKTFVKNSLLYYSDQVNLILSKYRLPFDSDIPPVETAQIIQNCREDVTKIAVGFFERVGDNAARAADAAARAANPGPVPELFRGTGFDLDKIIKNTDKILKMSDNWAHYNSRKYTARMQSATETAKYVRAGLTIYMWRTANDRRVVGNPHGKYPVGNPGHQDHYSRDKKIFRFDTPPSDGPPGWPYNCRCVMLPVLKDLLRKIRYG